MIFSTLGKGTVALRKTILNRKGVQSKTYGMCAIAYVCCGRKTGRKWIDFVVGKKIHPRSPLAGRPTSVIVFVNTPPAMESTDLQTVLSVEDDTLADLIACAAEPEGFQLIEPLLDRLCEVVPDLAPLAIWMFK